MKIAVWNTFRSYLQVEGITHELAFDNREGMTRSHSLGDFIFRREKG